MVQYTENILQDSGAILACEDESVFSALAHYYQSVEECEPLCGIPVRRFYSELEQEDYTFISTEAVSFPQTMLISDAQTMTLPFEILRQQDIICVYRTNSEGDFPACAERLTALQEDDGDGIRPVLIFFADAVAAKTCIIASGLWTPMNIQLVGIDRRDILPVFASTKENHRCISAERLCWEELPAADRAVRGAQILFRGTGEDFSFLKIVKKAEEVAACFSEATHILWQIEACEANEILMFSAREMQYIGVAPKNL